MRCNLTYKDYLKRVVKAIRTYDSNNILVYPSGKLEWTLNVLQGSTFTIKVEEEGVTMTFRGHHYKYIIAECYGEEVDISTSYLVNGGEVKCSGLLENESEPDLVKQYKEILQSLVDTKLLEKVKRIGE